MNTRATHPVHSTRSNTGGKIFFTSMDFSRLKNYLHGYIFSHSGSAYVGESVRQLNRKMSRAKVVEPDKISNDVVTMYSTAVIAEPNSEETSTYTIVYPDEANVDRDRISILSPIGSSLIGHRVMDAIEVLLPNGPKMYYIKEIIYQPEAEGIYRGER